MVDEIIENASENVLVLEEIPEIQNVLQELIDEVCNTNTTVLNASRTEKGESKESKNGFRNFKTIPIPKPQS